MAALLLLLLLLLGGADGPLTRMLFSMGSLPCKSTVRDTVSTLPLKLATPTRDGNCAMNSVGAVWSLEM